MLYFALGLSFRYMQGKIRKRYIKPVESSLRVPCMLLCVDPVFNDKRRLHRDY